jgi:oligopeptidase B
MDKPVSHPAPPAAEQRPYSYERHGVTIEDPWHWIRDQKYPQVDDKDVLAYLTAENAYFEHWAAQHRELLDTLFEEMKGRIKEDESSVPIRDGEWLYWWAFKPGAQYRTWYRRKFAGGDDQIIYDARGSRREGLFPPRRARGQSRRQARGHPRRRQRR